MSFIGDPRPGLGVGWGSPPCVESRVEPQDGARWVLGRLVGGVLEGLWGLEWGMGSGGPGGSALPSCHRPC